MAKKLAFKQGAYKEAVDYFKQKINLPTRRWNDLEGAMHTRAFTVAGAMRADILLDFRKAVDRAIEKGDSLQDFRNNFYDIAKKWRAADPSFDAKMEKPKYGAWRSKVIYQTNMVTAAAAAQERQARAMPDVFTHAKYICQMLPGSRDEHKAWNGTVLPVNDPWWEKHSPPNGFGCLCEKEFISKYEMDAGMEKQTKAPTAPNDTTNIGEKWDYSIGDADAENQRLKDYEEEKVQKVAKLYKNEDIKPLEKETKAKSKKQEQRRAEIRKMADERHANRTATEADKIQAKWTLSHPHSQMPKKFNGVGDIATFWNKIDKARETLGQERIFQNGDFKFGRINNKYNGDTSMDGTINLHRKIHDLCVSAFEKLRLGTNLSKDECRAIGTLWHEMTHNRHKLNGGIFHRPPGKSLDYMEMANEFVARKTLPELFGLIGAKSAPYKQFMISRDNCGYDDWVVRLDTALDTFGINKDSFLKQARTDLFDGNYNMQKELLVNNMASHVKGMDTADATKIVAQCIKYKGISFETDVLMPIKSKLGGKK
ncbi:MAG: hypothetical protein IK114_06495 [Fibrobacter sp.]|nr:hypothetical protein [Fibrobacter sp.]